MSKTQRQTTVPGAWSTDQILNVLAPKMARAAMGGKPQPVTAEVVKRLEALSAR